LLVRVKNVLALAADEAHHAVDSVDASVENLPQSTVIAASLSIFGVLFIIVLAKVEHSRCG
jgi:hypothetical protein